MRGIARSECSVHPRNAIEISEISANRRVVQGTIMDADSAAAINPRGGRVDHPLGGEKDDELPVGELDPHTESIR